MAKANAIIRDLRRRSKRRLFVLMDTVKMGTTTFPVKSGAKANKVQSESRA